MEWSENGRKERKISMRKENVPGRRRFTAAAFSAAVLGLAAASGTMALTSAFMPAYGAVAYFPGVTEEMTDPDYWVSNDPDADKVLMDLPSVRALNQRMVKEPDCKMFDLEGFVPEGEENGVPLRERSAETAYNDIMTSYVKDGYYHRDGRPVEEAFAEAMRDEILGGDEASFHTLRYGIVVRRTDLRAWPTDEIVTDEKGDIDFDYVQLSAVRVNEPVVIQGVSADGQWYRCHSGNCPGWVRAQDVALCAGKQEWLSAWKIPDDRVLVVTESRMALEYSNTSPDLSGTVLTMGTVLERADVKDPGAQVTNRSSYQNHVVWIPVRRADGSYEKQKALIAERHGVHEGYLPLTRRNLLRVAFNALGDAYGWGGMLSAEDCSGYLNALYRCFGMQLPRNTTWQAAAPLFRMDLTDLPDDRKSGVLSVLPAGSLLYFKGHTMLYLGERDGRHYVLSSVSSVMNPDGSGRLRVRSVILNDLNLKRANGTTWLSNLYTAVVPYLAPGQEGEGWTAFSEGFRYRRENGYFAAASWQQDGDDWYFFNSAGIAVTDCWVPDKVQDGVWYYVGADGKMVRNTVVDGYPVGEDGAYRE